MSSPKDQAPLIAAFLTDAPASDRFGLLAPWARMLSSESKVNHISAQLAQRFPSATEDEFRRGLLIAMEVMDQDRAERGHADAINNPCRCGAPGRVILVDGDNRPTGRRRCFECDIAEADGTPCAGSGAPLDGEDVRSCINLCVECDPEEISWLDGGAHG